MRDAIEAFVAGWESVAKSLPDAAMVAECARAQWTPLEACVDGIEKANRWVLERNLQKLGYTPVKGVTPKQGKGGKMVLASKGAPAKTADKKPASTPKKVSAKPKQSDAKSASPVAAAASSDFTKPSDKLRAKIAEMKDILGSLGDNILPSVKDDLRRKIERHESDLASAMVYERIREMEDKSEAAGEKRREDQRKAREQGVAASTASSEVVPGTSHYLFAVSGSQRAAVAGPYESEAAAEADLPRVRSHISNKFSQEWIDGFDFGKTSDKAAKDAFDRRIAQFTPELAMSGDGSPKKIAAKASGKKKKPATKPQPKNPAKSGDDKDVDSGDESLWSITVEQAGRNAMSKARAEDIAKLEEMKSLAKQGHHSVVGKFAPYKTKKDALADIAKKRDALDNPTRRDLIQYAQSAGADGRSHYSHVRRALDAGKAVPAEVLADYPDLVEKYGN